MISLKNGFTLIEILIALTVVTVGLIASLRSSSLSIDSSRIYQSHTRALWLASNISNKIIAFREWPDLGTTRYNSTYIGKELIIEKVVSRTPNPNFRRLEIRILDPNDQRQIHAITSLLSK
jgi:general secretion pathway protein I